MGERRRGPKSLKRKVGTRRERRTIVVFCEGEASEPGYLEALKRLPEIRENTSVTVEIDPCQGVPMTLVEAASERAGDDGVDECWCVFDVESPKNHPNLAEAVRLAEQNGIRLAVSNPCFELWLILHLRDQTAYLHTKDAESTSRKLDGRKGKRIDPTVYLPHRHVAVQRAAALTDRHERNGTVFPNDNPSSTMYALLAAIEPALR